MQKEEGGNDFYVPVLVMTGYSDQLERAVGNAVKLYNPEHVKLLENKLKDGGIQDFDRFVQLGKPFLVPELTKRAELIKSLYCQS